MALGFLTLDSATRLSQQATIARLSLLGWSQDGIDNVVGLSRPRVEQVLIETEKSQKLSKSVKDLVNLGKSIDEVAKALEIQAHGSSINKGVDIASARVNKAGG